MNAALHHRVSLRAPPAEERGRALASLLSAALVLLVSGCAMDRDPALVTCESDSHCPDGWYCPGTPETPATCTEGTRPGDDDDVAPDDDDTAPDDDDDTVDDDDDTGPVITDAIMPPGGLCAAPGRSTSASFAALHCTGPVVTSPGVSASTSFTVITGSAQLLQLTE